MCLLKLRFKVHANYILFACFATSFALQPLGVCALAKLVSIDITMANNANDFLVSLAAENQNTSRAQAQILLARRLAERQLRRFFAYVRVGRGRRGGAIGVVHFLSTRVECHHTFGTGPQEKFKIVKKV